MRNLNKIIVSSMIMVSPIFFSACNNENEVGRDRNVPNNVEDNYSGDADRNKTSDATLGNTSSSSNTDLVGRDKNVPNNIEDNYTGDADRNKVGENEEEVNRKASEMSTSAGNQMRRAENAMSNAVTMDKTYTAAEYNALQDRLTKLEKDVMDLKSKGVGPDIVGQK